MNVGTKVHPSTVHWRGVRLVRTKKLVVIFHFFKEIFFEMTTLTKFEKYYFLVPGYLQALYSWKLSLQILIVTLDAHKGSYWIK